MSVDPTRLTRALASIAPGTQLRDGLDRIVRGGTGALIVLDDGPEVLEVCTGGFALDTTLTSTSVRELAKMDGAIVVTGDLRRIVRAGVHLMPPASVATAESGTRHRTADRVARQTGTPVVTVSASMSTIALFIDGERHVVQQPDQLLARAHQALATLARFRDRLAEASSRLSALEVQDQVSVRDVALVAQRLATVALLRRELDRHVTELGVDGQLVALQLRELTPALDEVARLIGRDYGTPGHPLAVDSVLKRGIVGDLAEVATALGLPAELDRQLSPVGHRQLAQISPLPAALADRLLERFGTLQQLFGASPAEVASVEGMTPALTRAVRQGLVRMAESAYAEPMA